MPAENVNHPNAVDRETTNPAPFLESGQIIMHNSPGFADADDSLQAKNIIFNDQTIRKGFIRKVYFILLVSLKLIKFHVFALIICLALVDTIARHPWCDIHICVSRAHKALCPGEADGRVRRHDRQHCGADLDGLL